MTERWIAVPADYMEFDSEDAAAKAALHEAEFDAQMVVAKIVGRTAVKPVYEAETNERSGE